MELAKYAEILENHYGIPQDIEWGVEKNKIYILQSRPITTINNGKKPADSDGQRQGSPELASAPLRELPRAL